MRFSFYDSLVGARRLSEGSLLTQVADLKTILAHFKDQYQKLCLIGHSMGGLTALMANPDVAAMSLWDPSFDVTHFWSTWPCLTHMPEVKKYVLNYGNDYLLSEEMVEEMKVYNNAKCLKLAQAVKGPVQMIIPEESIFLASPHTSPEAYGAAFAGPFKLERLGGANHTFTHKGNAATLFKLTAEFFGKHL